MDGRMGGCIGRTVGNRVDENSGESDLSVTMPVNQSFRSTRIVRQPQFLIHDPDVYTGEMICAEGSEVGRGLR